MPLSPSEQIAMLRAELESQRLKYEEIIKKKNEELAKKIEENCALQKTNAARTLVSEQATTVQIEMWYGSPPGARVNGVCRA